MYSVLYSVQVNSAEMTSHRPYSLFFVYWAYLFYCHFFKVLSNWTSFIFLVYSKFHQGSRPRAPKTTTHRSPIMPPLKTHTSPRTHSILPKILSLFWVNPLHQPVWSAYLVFSRREVLELILWVPKALLARSTIPS